jgi:hypothetical protein
MENSLFVAVLAMAVGDDLGNCRSNWLTFTALPVPEQASLGRGNDENEHGNDEQVTHQ